MSYSNYSNTGDKEKIFTTVKEKRHYVQKNKGKGDSRGLINNASEMTVEQHFKNTGSGGDPCQPIVLYYTEKYSKQLRQNNFFRYTKAERINCQHICTNINVTKKS